jgi:hypothetical protein
MARHRGGIGEAGAFFFPERPSAVCLLGRMGHRNGDLGCEPARLTEHQTPVRARMGQIGRDRSAYRAQKSAMVALWRGFAMTEPITDRLRLPSS